MNDVLSRCYKAQFELEDKTPAGGIVVEFDFKGTEPVFIRNVSLARRNIGKSTRFATAFGYDLANVIEGRPPEAYQFRIGLYVRDNDKLLRGDAQTALRVTPPATLQYVLPIAKLVVDYFIDAHPDDVFVVVTHAEDLETYIPYGNILQLLFEAQQLGGLGDPPIDLPVELKIPFKETPTGEALANAFTQTVHAAHPKT